MERLLRKLGSWLALAAAVMVGVMASLFIAACGGKAEKESQPKPPDEPKKEAAKENEPERPKVPAKTPEKPKTETPAKPKVDRKEVEKGQPLPRNYLE